MTPPPPFSHLPSNPDQGVPRLRFLSGDPLSSEMFTQTLQKKKKGEAGGRRLVLLPPQCSAPSHSFSYPTNVA